MSLKTCSAMAPAATRLCDSASVARHVSLEKLRRGALIPGGLRHFSNRPGYADSEKGGLHVPHMQQLSSDGCLTHAGSSLTLYGQRLGSARERMH